MYDSRINTRKGYFSRLLSSEGLNSSFESLKQDLRLLLDVWKKRKDVFWGVVLGTFTINLLSIAFPIALLQVYDRVIPNQAISTLVLLLIGVIVALMIEMFLKICRFYLSGWSDAKFKFFMGNQLFHHLIHSELQAFEKEGAGAHVKRLDSLNLMQDFYSGQAIISLVDVPFLLFFLFLIFYIGGWLVFIALLVLAFFIIRLFPYLNQLQEISEANHMHEEIRNNYIVETLGNIHTVKSMAMEAQMLRRYERLQKRAAVYDHDTSVNNANFATLTKNSAQVMIVAVVGFGSLLVMNGQMTVGGLAACMLLSTRCIQPINTLATVWSRLKSIAIAHQELQALLKTPLESTIDLPVWPGRVEGNIEFKEVGYRQDEHADWIIKDMNLTIQARECIAIEGSWHTGKSALLSLMAGLLTPSQGTILVDGKDVADYQIGSLRDQIGYLPEKPILFEGTIMENLIGFQGREYEERAKQIVEFIGLAPIIKELTDGYNTVVATRATEALSRGIRQRIVIARALLKEPPIVLFDEANSSIDLRGDVFVKKLLERLLGRCTLVLVSYRPSILSLAKKRYRIENGKLSVVV